jgi:hypothetical protein
MVAEYRSIPKQRFMVSIIVFFDRIIEILMNRLRKFRKVLALTFETGKTNKPSVQKGAFN